MTAQIEDRFLHRKKRYSLVAITDSIGFDPREYGLIPEARCTACWRGYFCEYKVAQEGLFLQNLFINTKDEIYPPVNGVPVSEMEYHECTVISFKDGKQIQRKEMSENNMGHREYKDVNIPMAYTGKILLGDEFLRKYYIHMGFQRSWAYKELVEFEFDNGKLVKKTDHSDTAQKLREILDSSGVNPAHPEGENIPKFVSDSFSLDYAVKAWWLEKDAAILDLIKKTGL